MLQAGNVGGSGLGARGGGGGPLTPIARQASIYSLTLDELQRDYEPTKNFGSMNMDEFLKNIWTAEETQAMAAVMSSANETNGSGGSGGSGSGSGLLRQGSLVRQRSTSFGRKTVEEVWHDIHKKPEEEAAEVKKKKQSKESNMGLMTLEDFLVKAGVVAEEPEEDVNVAAPAAASGGALVENGFPFRSAPGVRGGTYTEAPSPAANIGTMVESVAAAQNQQQQQQQQQQEWMNYQHQVQQHHFMQQQAEASIQQQQQQFMQQQAVDQATAVAVMGNKRGPGHALVALPGTPSPDSNRNSGGGTRTVERRQRRMIKNRESAARSRARKQAYTVELEAEVMALKEENAQLRQKETTKAVEPEAGPQQKLRRTRTSSF